MEHHAACSKLMFYVDLSLKNKDKNTEFGASYGERSSLQLVVCSAEKTVFFSIKSRLLVKAGEL